MTRNAVSAIVLAVTLGLILLVQGCVLDGLPPDLAGLAGLVLVLLVLAPLAFVLGRWSRG